MNEIETGRRIQRINGTKSWFFRKINKNDKLLSKRERERESDRKLNKVGGKKGDIAKKKSVNFRVLSGHILQAFTLIN